MTQAEAQAEAVRRWGKKGIIYRATEQCFKDAGLNCFVGIKGRKVWVGQGLSWKKAFADAEARTKPENQTKTNKGG